MKASIAKRVTTCAYCQEPIPAGEKRLTDRIHRKSSRDPKGFVLIDKHYHFRKEDQTGSCYDVWAEEYFERMPESKRVRKSNNPKGRPKLDITDEQRVIRKKLLLRLYRQFDYYLYSGRLDLTERQLVTNITEIDVRRATRFAKNIRYIIEELEKVGGVPNRYKHIADSIQTDDSPVPPEERQGRLDRVSNLVST